MFQVGQIYLRREIHQMYGGQHQTGICTPSDQPYIFLFTGGYGEKRGYVDGWTDDGTFSYSGHGQSGDMKFQRGNAAVRDHAANGKDLYLFETIGDGRVKYVGQMVYGGYRVIPDQPDANEILRNVIQFHLVELSVLQDAAVEEHVVPMIGESRAEYSAGEIFDTREDEEVSNQRAKLLAKARAAATKFTVLRRAHGKCEGCGAPAPFLTTQGDPYLEPHHVRRLTDGGADDPRWVIALCPNCHRRAHHSRDRVSFTAELKELLAAMTNESVLISGSETTNVKSK